MKQDQLTFSHTMAKVRLETLSAAHNSLVNRTASKRGRSGVRVMEHRTKDALHRLMAAQLFEAKQHGV